MVPLSRSSENESPEKLDVYLTSNIGQINDELFVCLFHSKKSEYRLSKLIPTGFFSFSALLACDYCPNAGCLVVIRMKC